MLDQWLDGRLLGKERSSERELFSYWNDKKFYQFSSVDIAVKFAAETISLEGVFVAGYQAALNTLFPDPTFNGWSGFLFSENRQGSSNLSPATLVRYDRGFILSGSKNWVAQSRHVGRLIVTLRPSNSDLSEIGGVIIDSGADGVSIFHYESVKFLSNLSQGWAVFDKVRVEKCQFFGRASIRKFKEVESNFMILSILSFLIYKSFSLQKKPSEKLRSLCEKYYFSLKKADDGVCKKLITIQSEVKECIDHVIQESPPMESRWGNNKKLLYMYLPS